MLCTLCGALLTDAEIEKCQEELILPSLCFDCLEEMEEDELEKLRREYEDNSNRSDHIA